MFYNSKLEKILISFTIIVLLFGYVLPIKAYSSSVVDDLYEILTEFYTIQKETCQSIIDAAINQDSNNNSVVCEEVDGTKCVIFKVTNIEEAKNAIDEVTKAKINQDVKLGTAIRDNAVYGMMKFEKISPSNTGDDPLTEEEIIKNKLIDKYGMTTIAAETIMGDGYYTVERDEEGNITDVEITATMAYLENLGVTTEGVNLSYQENHGSALDQLDVEAGIILEPLVEFVSFIMDTVMTILTSIMTQDNLDFVMSSTVANLSGEATAKCTIGDMTKYQNVLGSVSLRYPNFKYSPEEIFSGKIELLDINFIDGSNSDESWQKIRSVVSQWYKIIRMITIVGLLSVLIYTGIKIIISSNAKDKAKYKELIVNWFIAVVLAFSLHYIMVFILAVIEEVMGLFNGITGVIEVHAGTTTFKTNLIGLARFQLQQQSFTAKVSYLIIYTALVVYTFKFTFLYFKRVLKVAFLTIISPIVALTYPIDKMEGKAKGFEMWLKEFLYNALLQPLHYILYYILVSTSLTLTARNPIYGIAALMFISQAEKLLKKIFGFDKANGGTVGGIAGAYTTGAITGALTNMAKNPLHPFGGGSGKGGNAGKNTTIQGQLGYGDDELPNDLIDDIDPESFIYGNIGATSNPVIANQTTEGQTLVNDSISRYRGELGETDLGELSFDDGDSRSINTLLRQILQCQNKLVDFEGSPEESLALNNQILQLENMLQNRIMANESGFNMYGIPLQYTDGDSRSTSDLMNEVIRLRELSNNSALSDGERKRYSMEARRLLQKIKRRMAENQQIDRQGGARALFGQSSNVQEQSETSTSSNSGANQDEISGIMDRIKNAPVTKGIKNVGKTIIKPVIDTDKSARYNAKKLAGKILKGAAGTLVGVTAATVQAGISITDGKYNPLEGVATIGAGITGVSNLGAKPNGIAQAYREGAYSEEGESLQRYSEQWYNRDDVISNYNREFPGKGKEMRQRAVNNYVSRGITDFKEQKQAMKFANMLKEERGMDEDEADRIAAATLRYKQSLSQNSNYNILYDEKKRNEYLDIKADTYSGSASKDSIRRVHEDFIKNVVDFDKANR